MIKQIVKEGVSYDKDNDCFTFNFEHDGENDIIKLLAEGPFQIKDFNPCTFFGYVFEDNIQSNIKKEFIDLIKYPSSRIQKEDLNRFVSYSVNSLDKKISLPKYDVIVHPESSSKLNNQIIHEIYLKSLSKNILDFKLIKELPSKMNFNYNMYSDYLKNKEGVNDNNLKDSIKAIENMMDKLKKLNYVKIGTYVKAKYRIFLENFFTFESKEAEKTFKTLQNKNILIVDDISTTMATLHYVLNTIRSLNDTNQITMFCLLGNKIKK